MKGRNVNPYDLSQVAQADRERHPYRMPEVNHEAICMTRALSDALEAAEAAEKQLAEAQARIVHLERLVDEALTVATMCNDATKEQDES